MTVLTFRLGDIAEQITDGTHLSPNYVDCGIPMLDSKHIKNDFSIDDSDAEKFISIETDKLLAQRCKPIAGDILISSRGTIGKIAIVKDGQNFNIMGNMILVRLGTSIDKRYFLHYLSRSLEYLVSLARGVAQKGLYLNQVRDLVITIPPLAEQQRIAALLDTADRILRLRESAIAKLEKLIRSYFDEIVLNSSNSVQLVELGSVVELKYGKSLPSQNRRDGEFNVYGSNGVVGSHSESITSGETIIVGRKGSFGEINLSFESCFPIDTTYFIDINATKQNIVWLRYALETLKLNTLNKSAAVPGLNREDAYRQKLQLISLNLQNDFEMLTRKVWDLIKIQNDFIHKHKRLIASIQHQSFAVN